MGTVHPQKKTWARSVLVDADKERQNGTDGGWQQETLYKEDLELVRPSFMMNGQQFEHEEWTSNDTFLRSSAKPLR